MPIKYSTVLVAVAIGILPVLGWMAFIVKKSGAGFAKWDFVLKVFFWGVLTAVPASLLQIFLIETEGETYLLRKFQELFLSQNGLLFSGTLLSSLVVATIEELSKGIAILFAIFKNNWFTVGKGLLIGMIVGLAFGVTENGVYFASAIRAEQGLELILVIILRFMLSTSAHIIYSGVMGVLVAEALALGNGLERTIKFVLAICFPVVIHAMFNFVLSTDRSWLSLLIVVAGFIFLWMKFSLYGNSKQESKK